MTKPMLPWLSSMRWCGSRNSECRLSAPLRKKICWSLRKPPFFQGLANLHNFLYYLVNCEKWFARPLFPFSSLSYSFAVMPENSNFPYRRYDRLPPIHQFSIESDTDLSETAELIEEYEVFDPTRPRPKIILVIGAAASVKLSNAADLACMLPFQKCWVG